MEWLRRWRRDLSTITVLAVLLLAVYELPPDTSFAEVMKAGVLRVCLPVVYPPLVTGKADQPGFDVELLRKITSQLGVRLEINANPIMGQDFNPRNWRVTRAQCQVLAGGIVASSTTLSFLDTTQPYLETGWALIHRGDALKLSGSDIGFYSGISGLDRIALSRYLRSQGAQVEIVSTTDDLAKGIQSGGFAGGVSEALLAGNIATSHDWQVSWLLPAQRYPIALGLWKGDLTLKRRLVALLREDEQNGTISALATRYHIEIPPL